MAYGESCDNMFHIARLICVLTEPSAARRILTDLDKLDSPVTHASRIAGIDIRRERNNAGVETARCQSRSTRLQKSGPTSRIQGEVPISKSHRAWAKKISSGVLSGEIRTLTAASRDSAHGIPGHFGFRAGNHTFSRFFRGCRLRRDLPARSLSHRLAFNRFGRARRRPPHLH